LGYSDLGFKGPGIFGFRVQGPGSKVQSPGTRVQSPRFRYWSLELWAKGSEFRIQSLGFRVKDAARVWGCGDFGGMALLSRGSRL